MADPTKLMQLLEIAKKFGVKPSKVIGTQGNIVPFKKPSLVDIRVDEFKLKDSVDQGNITMDKVKQEMEETVKLALSKNLDDVELNRALNNAVNLDRVFFPPMAEVVEAGSKQQVTGKGLEELIKKEGLVASPKTPLGKIQLQGKRLEQEAKDLSKEFDLGALIKGAGKDQLSEIKLHNEGLVRAVTRQILSEDIKAGKIKNLTLEDLGTSREPIDYFRKIYGEDALERLDSLTPEFNRLNTEQEAAGLARSKFKFEPDETRTKGSISYEELEKNIKGSEQPKETKVLDITIEGNKRKSIDDLIDEYNANQDRLRLSDEEGGTAIGYQEFQDIQKRNEDIAKALEEKGISSAIEEEVKPEGIVIPFRKKFPKPEPEGKAQGGIIGYAMGGRTGYAEGTPIAGLAIKSLGPVNTNMTQEQINQYINSPVPIGLMVPQNEMLPNETYLDFVRRKRKEEMYPLSLTANILPGTGGFPGGPLSPTTTTSDSTPLTVRDRYNKYLSAAGSGTSDELYKSYRANLDKKADGGRIGYAKGKKVMSSIDKLLEDMNKKLSKKKSMESVNPKTGEVTVPKKPIRKAEEPTGVTIMDQEPIDAVESLRNKHKDAFEAHDQIRVDIGDKIAPDMIAESMAEMKGKDYFDLSQKKQSDYYKKALAYVDDVRMTKRQNKMSISNEMNQAKQEGIQKTNKMIELGLDPSSSKDYDKFLEMESIQQKYGNVIDNNLLQKIMVDDNPQRKAEVMATLDEAIKMQEKGIAPEEIINIIKNTTRTKQADGGIAGLL